MKGRLVQWGSLVMQVLTKRRLEVVKVVSSWRERVEATAALWVSVVAEEMILRWVGSRSW